ncbi:membrane-spanning 4-domains subfamily A member 4A-like isoform X2 [Dendropsophus ebraccatus]
MSPPVASDGGGFVVISQVGLQNDGQSHNAAVSLPKPLTAFYRGEPEALGTTQLFSAILVLSIGILIIVVQTQIPIMDMLPYVSFSGVTIWSGILCIISGSLSVVASAKPSLGKVRASLVMNIFSSLATVCGIILAPLDISVTHQSYSPHSMTGLFCAHYKGDMECLGDFTPLPLLRGTLVFLFMLFTLIFSINISTSVFACKAVCRSSLTEMQVVIYQTTSLKVSDPTQDVPPGSSAALTSD